MWNYEGLTVSGLYLDMIPVKGKVYMSRVKYGGGVSHHLMLDEPVEVFGKTRDRVTLDMREVTQVHG